MGLLDISVRFDELRREPSGNVKGKFALHLSGNVLGKDYDRPVDARNFDFPRGGEQKDVYNEEFKIPFPIKDLKVRVKATVHEHTPGQCCLQGRIEGEDPIKVEKDLDPNCHPIPEG